MSLVLVVLVAVGCGGSGPPDGEPDVVGALSGFEEGQSRALLERSDDCPLSLSHDDGTRVFRETADGNAEIEWVDLRRGEQARVWLDGGFADSCPALALAEAIVVEAPPG